MWMFSCSHGGARRDIKTECEGCGYRGEPEEWKDRGICPSCRKVAGAHFVDVTQLRRE